jgi:hypothetical protein
MGDGPAHKATISVALAEGGRGGEVRQVGVFENRPEIMTKLVAAEHARPSPKLLLRSRPLRLWVAPAADQVRA